MAGLASPEREPPRLSPSPAPLSLPPASPHHITVVSAFLPVSHVLSLTPSGYFWLAPPTA